MNELKVFNNPEFGDIPTEKQFSALGALAYILSQAILADSEEEAWAFLRAASIVGHQLDCTVFNALYGEIACRVALSFDRHNEFYYQALFTKHAQKVIEGCSIIKHSDDCHHRPDAWISWKGQVAPVEVKLHDFNRKALSQLQRYMNFYHSKIGIAVGRRLTVEIPSNIQFVSLKELEEAENG